MRKRRAELADWVPIEDILTSTTRLLRGGHVYAALLAVGLWRTIGTDGAGLVRVCSVCGAGGGLLGWALE